jgi:hypothetical protein
MLAHHSGHCPPDRQANENKMSAGDFSPPCFKRGKDFLVSALKRMWSLAYPARDHSTRDVEFRRDLLSGPALSAPAPEAQ